MNLLSSAVSEAYLSGTKLLFKDRQEILHYKHKHNLLVF